MVFNLNVHTVKLILFIEISQHKMHNTVEIGKLNSNALNTNNVRHAQPDLILEYKVGV
jgi:hypothetical protein